MSLVWLHLYRRYRDYQTGRAEAEHSVSRIHLNVKILHPRTGYEAPREYRGILDTGAERTVIPFSAVEHFDKASPVALIQSTPGKMRLADGTLRENIPCVDVAFQFSGLSGSSRDERRVQRVSTYGQRDDRSWRSFRCYAITFDAPDASSVREPLEQVIIGMDLIRFWLIDMKGPESRYAIGIDANVM